MRASFASLVAAVFAAFFFFFVVGCDAPAVVGCKDVCDVRPPACDDGCPALANEVCVEGVCEGVVAGDIDVALTVALGRGITDATVAVAIGYVDVRGGATCDDVGAVKDADNVVAGNRIEVSGGGFHPDLRVGLLPAGDYLVVVDALDDGGAVLASNCVAASFDADDSLIVDVPAI